MTERYVDVYRCAIERVLKAVGMPAMESFSDPPWRRTSIQPPSPFWR